MSQLPRCSALGFGEFLSILAQSEGIGLYHARQGPAVVEIHDEEPAVLPQRAH